MKLVPGDSYNCLHWPSLGFSIFTVFWRRGPINLYFIQEWDYSVLNYTLPVPGSAICNYGGLSLWLGTMLVSFHSWEVVSILGNADLLPSISAPQDTRTTSSKPSNLIALTYIKMYTLELSTFYINPQYHDWQVRTNSKDMCSYMSCHDIRTCQCHKSLTFTRWKPLPATYFILHYFSGNHEPIIFPWKHNIMQKGLNPITSFVFFPFQFKLFLKLVYK